MCGLCGTLGVDHWAETGGDRRTRVFRVALLGRILARDGLSLDDWGGALYVLRDRKGRAEVVDNLGAVWQAAEQLAGRPLDPLDPSLVRALQADE